MVPLRGLLPRAPSVGVVAGLVLLLYLLLTDSDRIAPPGDDTATLESAPGQEGSLRRSSEIGDSLAGSSSPPDMAASLPEVTLQGKETESGTEGLTSDGSEPSDDRLPPTPNRHGTNTTNHILLWNPFFHTSGYGVGLGLAPFANCPVTCELTADRGRLSDAAAVVIHTFYSPKTASEATLPTRGHPRQVFVFFLMENPARSVPGLQQLNASDLFNLTFTYAARPDTDIHSPYGGVVRRPTPDPAAVPTTDALRRKPELVAWLVSNCAAPSSRYAYVDDLSKHIPVQVFGKCGQDVCTKGIDCLAFLEKDFLFYLALENGYCEDYLTEKVFAALETSMVPVVLGGANYTRYLPPNSFIDVRDYTSPKHLADHLIHLSQNPDLLRRHLDWKRDYRLRSAQWYKFQGFCRLCEILQTDGYPYKSGFEPLSYWSRGDCLEGAEERKAVHLTQ